MLHVTQLIYLLLLFSSSTSDGFRHSVILQTSPLMMQPSSISRLNLQDNEVISGTKTVSCYHQPRSTSEKLDNNAVVRVFQPAPVKAEYRAAQKSTYFRTVPKFITGRDYYRSEIKNAIDKEKWDVIIKFFERYPSKINKNDPNQIDAYDTYVNKYLYRPLKLLTSSFAEKGVSTKQQELLEKEQAFEAAMDELEGCIKDRKKGFFATTIKATTGKERKEQAIRAYEAGSKALDEFVTILNNGLMLELNKIPL